MISNDPKPLYQNKSNIPTVGFEPGISPSQGNGNRGRPDGTALNVGFGHPDGKVGFGHPEGMPLQGGTIVGVGMPDGVPEGGVGITAGGVGIPDGGVGMPDGAVGMIGLARAEARKMERGSQEQCILEIPSYAVSDFGVGRCCVACCCWCWMQRAGPY